jgi:hypothetical protein
LTAGFSGAANSMRSFQSQQAFYKILVSMAHRTFLFHEAFALLGFFGEDVSFESFLESNFPCAGDLKSFFGTRVCFNLWHLIDEVFK